MFCCLKCLDKKTNNVQNYQHFTGIIKCAIPNLFSILQAQLFDISSYIESDNMSFILFFIEAPSIFGRHPNIVHS